MLHTQRMMSDSSAKYPENKLRVLLFDINRPRESKSHIYILNACVYDIQGYLSTNLEGSCCYAV